jgi:hypothetical protein
MIHLSFSDIYLIRFQGQLFYSVIPEPALLITPFTVEFSLNTGSSTRMEESTSLDGVPTTGKFKANINKQIIRSYYEFPLIVLPQ